MDLHNIATVLLMLILLSRCPTRCAPFSGVSRPTAVASTTTTTTTTRTASRARQILRCHGTTTDNGGGGVEISPSNHGTTRLTSFSGVFEERLEKYLKVSDLRQPTPIQAHVIPLLLKGFDVMASAQTGSGKTLMFSLPLSHQLQTRQDRRYASPAAIILNPTRELAMQTESVVKGMTKRSVRTALAVGGVRHQREHVRDCDILVGTPGRILQYIDERVISLRDTQHVVIDEADRMVDLGFEPQLRRISRSLGRQNSQLRQTVLCSATFPAEVQRIAADFLKPEYYFVSAGRVGGMHSLVKQRLVWVRDNERHDRAVQEVRQFLSGKTDQRVIVFCNKKEDAERLGTKFRGTSSRVVTGDKTQKERNESLKLFRDGKFEVLIATDVAARGLHVDDVGLVVQVDAPRDVDTFVHRIGRTGRAGATGDAIALLDGRSVGIASNLVDLLLDANQKAPPWLLGMSYVARARRMEEEAAISAGGGGGTVQTIQSDTEEDVSDVYSGQDFRRDASAGSWGSGRDTSYHAFDEEAYSRFDDVSMAMSDVPKQSSSKSEDRSEDKVMQLPDNEANMKIFSSGSRVLERQQPSEALLDLTKRHTGRDDIGIKPNPQVLRDLSKQHDQKLKFEYLGLFDFADVANLLGSQNQSKNMSESRSKLPKLLMVAEKPSIANAIADALSGPRGPRQRRGISRALPVYEFTSDAFVPEKRDGKRQKCHVSVTSVVGHVFSLGFVEDEEAKNRGHTDPSAFFHLPVVKQEEGSTGKLRVVDHLRALAAECDHLVLWLDCDAEGENIAHEVIGVVRRALEQKIARELQEKPGATVTRRIHRAKFSAISKEAICDAFERLEEPDAALSRSVDARQELDLRIGVAMTRLLNWRCVGLARKNFSPATKLVSYGPCQTPALSFCIDRAKEIESFRPEEYQKIHVACKLSGKHNSAFNPRWIPPDEEENELQSFSSTFDEGLAKWTVKEITSSGKLRISQVTESPEKRDAPLGLNTVALLTSASKAMGMSPKQAMSVAEKLYSSGFISYPRTETTRYDPNGFDVRSVLRDHQSHPEWGKTASYLLRGKYSKSTRPPLRGHDAGDHPPITPLKSATRDEIGGGNQWRVYDFITRTFLGSLSDDLQYTRRIAELEVVGSDKRSGSQFLAPRFDLEQVVVDSLGFAGACRWVLNDIGASKQTDTVGDQVVLRKGLEFSVSKAISETCRTRPPKFLQEHELVQLMDQNRIGTDASMATHINNIVDRGYVTLCDENGVPLRPPPRPGQPRRPRQVGRYLVPTSLGMNLFELFQDGKSKGKDVGSLPQMSRPAIRAQMEAEVKQIALGETTKEDCLSKNLAWFESRYHELNSALSRDRVSEFGHSLCRIDESLKYWRRLGAFEDQISKDETGSNRKAKGKYKGAKSSQRIQHSNKSHKGRNRKAPPRSRARSQSTR
mmetsp:Transcript_13507/g.32873  ORF Transcript_13507/g.32873 Transcript_13507/m.32873 type:complete len:1427 (+) Transcript_13507:71-4351(+)